MKSLIFIPHPNEHKREQQGNSQDSSATACQPECEGLQQRVGEDDQDGSHRVDPKNPPGSQDIPQQKTDKGVVENGIRVGVMPDFRFQE